MLLAAFASSAAWTLVDLQWLVRTFQQQLRAGGWTTECPWGELIVQVGIHFNPDKLPILHWLGYTGYINTIDPESSLVPQSESVYLSLEAGCLDRKKHHALQNLIPNILPPDLCRLITTYTDFSVGCVPVGHIDK